MTKLEIVNKALQECRIPGTRPTALVGETLSRQVQLFNDWADDAWLEIQGIHNDWNFLEGDFSFQTVANDGVYTPADAGLTDHRRWLTDTLRNYLTTTGVADDMFMTEWTYGTFRDTYLFGSQVNDRPFNFAVRPEDDALLLGPKPSDIYTVYGRYRKEPTILAADDAEPPLRNHLHMIIVYKVMIFYGLEQAAPEIIARGEAGFARLLTIMEREELPDVSFGESFA